MKLNKGGLIAVFVCSALLLIFWINPSWFKWAALGGLILILTFLIYALGSLIGDGIKDSRNK